MNSSLRIVLLTNALALMAGCLSGKTAHDVDPAKTLAIRLYNQAQVPGEVLHSAIGQSTSLFRSAAVVIVWEKPVAESPEDRGTDVSSAVFPRADMRRYIVVRLLRRMPESVFPGALGYALPFAHTGAHVVIFFDRVEALHARTNTPTYIILGYAMAHEIAHVLLGSSEHSSGGLMQGRWTPATWRLASAGLLSFRPEELERMRANLRNFQPRGPTPQLQPELASVGTDGRTEIAAALTAPR